MDASYFSALAENGTMASRWTNPVHFPSVRPSIVHTSCRGTDAVGGRVCRHTHADAVHEKSVCFCARRIIAIRH